MNQKLVHVFATQITNYAQYEHERYRNPKAQAKKKQTRTENTSFVNLSDIIMSSNSIPSRTINLKFQIQKSHYKVTRMGYTYSAGDNSTRESHTTTHC